MNDRGSSRPHRRWFTALEALVFTVGLLMLLWGADALSRIGAESLLERNIQDVTGVAERPDVQVSGAVFLPQAIRGAYDEVHVTVRGISGGPLRVQQVQARLYDVRVPLRDVLLQDIRRVGIGRSADRVTLRFQDLNSYFEITGRAVRLAGSEDGLVRLTGFFDVLGQTVQASAAVELSVDGNQLRISPREPVDTGNTTLTGARRLLLTQRLTFTVPLDTLPFGGQLTGLSTQPAGLLITAEGRRIILRP